MKRSRQLAVACSAALVGAWASHGVAQNSQQQGDQSRTQQTQTQGQAGQKSATTGKVSQKAGQPTNVLVIGTVTDARDVKLASSAGDQHKLLKVKPKNGDEIVVDIGAPQGNTAAVSFSKGDRIVAMGKPARINGRPVLFAASVAEMQQVGKTGANMKSPSSGQQQSQQTASNQSGGSQSSQSSGQTADGKQGSRGQGSGYDAVVYLFTTDNLAQDKYGPYDEDFAWETNDSTYSSWNDTAGSWDSTEFAHYDMFGYDDRGEEGLWDW